MTAIKECPTPWCVKHEPPYIWQGPDNLFARICPSCQVHGPPAANESDADDLWNDRPIQIQMDGCIGKDQALAMAKHHAEQSLAPPDITPANAYDQAEKVRLIRMDGIPARYGRRIHPDHALVLDQASINALARSLRLMHSQATDHAASALLGMIDDFEMMGLIHQLREYEGNAIQLISDNADFNGQANCAIIANGDWTGYIDRRIEGETLIDCLRQALAEKEIYDAT